MKIRLFFSLLILGVLFSFTGCKGFWDVTDTGESTVNIYNGLSSRKIITEITLIPADTSDFREPTEFCDIEKDEKCIFENVPVGQYTVKFMAKDEDSLSLTESEFTANGGDLLDVKSGIETDYYIKNASVQDGYIGITNYTGSDITEVAYTVEKDNWGAAKERRVKIEEGNTCKISVPEGEYYFNFKYSVSDYQTYHTQEYEGDCVSDGKVKIKNGEISYIKVYEAEENSVF